MIRAVAVVVAATLLVATPAVPEVGSFPPSSRLENLAGCTAIPFVLKYSDGKHPRSDFEATLNQDGSWTLRGDPDRAEMIEGQTGHNCVLRRLREFRPASNPSPNNSCSAIFDYRRIMCRSEVLRPCNLEFGIICPRTDAVVIR